MALMHLKVWGFCCGPKHWQSSSSSSIISTGTSCPYALRHLFFHQRPQAVVTLLRAFQSNRCDTLNDPDGGDALQPVAVFQEYRCVGVQGSINALNPEP